LHLSLEKTTLRRSKHEIRGIAKGRYSGINETVSESPKRWKKEKKKGKIGELPD